MKYGDVVQLKSEYVSKNPSDTTLRVMVVREPIQPPTASPAHYWMEELFVGIILTASPDSEEVGDLHGGWLADAFEVVP